MGKRIASTGISGYIGTKLAARLERMEDIQQIVGVDRRAPAASSAKLVFYQQDILEPLTSIIAENQVDTVVHLVFVLNPWRDREEARRINVGGAIHLLEACREAGVQHLLYFSSTAVYGAHLDNPAAIGEDAPLRPLRSFQYSWDKAEVDRHLEIVGSYIKPMPVMALFRRVRSVFWFVCYADGSTWPLEGWGTLPQRYLWAKTEVLR